MTPGLGQATNLKYSLIFLLIVSVSFTLISSTLKQVKFAATTDEGYYLKYAIYISEGGISRFPDLFKDYIENPEHWVFPNPLRVGFIVLSSIWLRIFGYSFMSLACLSLSSYCIFLFISFYFVRKYFKEKTALLFTVLLAFSPLNMAMARRALMEATVNLFMISSIWLFLESMRERSVHKTILFVLIYTFTILTKETSVLLSIFFIFYIFMRRSLFKESFRLIDFLAVTFFPFAIVGGTYIISAGGITDVLATGRIIITSPQSNQMAILLGSGPWFRYLIDFMLLSPWVCILAIGFSFRYITKENWQEEIFYLLSLSVSLIFLLSFFSKNIRYLIVLDMPMRLFTILMLNELVERIFRRKQFFILTILVVAISLLDYANFYNLFIRHGIYDPVSQWLLQFRHIIPWR